MLRTTPLTDASLTANIMRSLGLEPDPWQVEVLHSDHPQLLLNCCRQAGKSTVVAVLALVEALVRHRTTVVLISRSHRQSRELLKQMARYYHYLGEKGKVRSNAQEIEFENESRVISLPCREDTIRGYANINVLIIDEAARVPDDLYRAVRPMLAVSQGRLICLSTPYGKRGFFWNAWARGGADWARIEITAAQCPRITADFLEQEKRALGESWFRQEYCCSFEALEGLVYPDFARCVVATLPPHVQALVHSGRAETTGSNWIGGIDFGFYNPFAAIWGVVDRDDILWLVGEHYARQKPLRYHAEHLPRHVVWYADPAGASDIAELRCAGFVVRSGANAVRSGIAAVTARLEARTLRVLEGRCPNLLAEAGLYRHGETAAERQAENPVKEHDHALDALRYLISRLDARRMAGLPAAAPEPPRPTETPVGLDEDDERFWIPLGTARINPTCR